MVGDFSVIDQEVSAGASACSRSGEMLTKKRNAIELFGLVLYLEGSYDSSTVYNLQRHGIVPSIRQSEGSGEYVYCSHGYNMKRRNLNEAFRYMRMGLKYA
jgi:hypothetical protein